MRKNKRAKITPDDLVTQARNESLPPHIELGEEWTDSPDRAPGTRSAKTKKTVEKTPRLGEEQAP